ncbi:MAG: cyclic nucleotide-binding domain-containing protein [candidate division Zixibacteria bacterium]|nr:cyclic nucleotide-binding domain-containing protein [Candidatus Tariuqbacter arcticus]
METLDIVLAEHPCLKGFDPKHLKILADCSSSVKFEPDQFIYREGDPANRFFLIRRGRVGLEVSIPNRGFITIEIIGSGELLGWSWLIPPYKCQFTARVHELTQAIALDGQYLRTQCHEDHELGYEFYSFFSDIIVRRLQATLRQLSSVYNERF